VAYSPDGKTVLTGSRDNTARLWDAATGRPLGPPMAHQGRVVAVAFSPDGKAALTGSADGTARLWDVSELPGNQERISTWVEVITGLGLDEFGSVNVLNNTTWHERREKLETQGGPPTTGPRWSLDPILFGPDPTARAKAWMERKRWAEAEAAFDEAVAARPFDTAILLERARFLIAHSQGQKADDDFARAYFLGDREPALLDTITSGESLFRRVVAESAGSAAPLWAKRGESLAKRRFWTQAADCYARVIKGGPTDEGHFWFEYAALLLLSGDRPGYVRACAHMIERCGKDGGPRSYHVARACTLAPDAIAEASRPGRLAEKELRESAREFWSLTEQGALAYRAGQFQESVPYFEQSLRADSKSGRAVLNWLWLALANQRLGKAEEARRWLDKAQTWLDQYRDGMPARAEEEFGLHYHNWLEAHVLRREAEALIPSEGPRSGPENRERGAAQK
jgi:tetratricopeptide (TPR) repeat protein